MAARRVHAHGPTRLKSDPNSVAALSVQYQRMAFLWDPIKDLLGDTVRMREARTKWLPMETNEDTQAYEIRLNRSYLFNGVKDTLRKVVSRPFAEPVLLTGPSLPEPLDHIEDNVDLNGTNLSTFAATSFHDAATYGLTFCFVDYPVVDEGITLAQSREQNIRPYFTHISAEDLIGFRSRKLPNGSKVLDEVRWKDSRTIPDGRYGTQNQNIIYRVVAPPRDDQGRIIEGAEGLYELYGEVERKNSGVTGNTIDYELISSGTHKYPGIPLAVDYFERVGFMEAEPPFADLSWKNIEHWQKGSDHNNILRFSRFGILFGSGMDEEVIEKGLTIGPSRLIAVAESEAKLQYVDSSGAVGAMKIGMDDLKSIEDQMEVLGMAPFVRPTANMRAMGQVINKGQNEAPIMRWIRNHVRFLRECYQIAATWVSSEIPEDFGIQIHKDFKLGMLNIDDAASLESARQRRDLDRRTYLEELQRRGIISDDQDLDDIIARLEEEKEFSQEPVEGFEENEDEEQTEEDEEDQD